MYARNDNIFIDMVKDALKNLGQGLFKVQETILSAAVILALCSGINAFLGLVKGRLLANAFGISDELSVFYTADKIPNLMYSVLVVGTLSTIFIPVFAETLDVNKESAWKTATTMILASLAFFLLLGGVVFIGAPFVIRLLSIGRFSPEEIGLGANLMRVMLAAQIFLILGSFITSILHSFKYFLVPALAPILYNLGMLFGIVFLSSSFGIYGPTIGVVIGALLHFLIQIPLLRKVGFRVILRNGSTVTPLKKILSLMPARILSVLFANVISTVNNSLAILVSTSSVVFLKFASQLQFFPVNLFGVSVASALLPTLSHNSSATNKDTFKNIFITSLHQMLFLVIPASVVLIILRVPVVRIVYGVANFPWEATVKTSYALAFFGLSIFAQSGVYLLTRAFYALKDTFTPVKVSSITIGLNILLSFTFVRYLGFGVWAVAFAYSITSFIDLVLLFIWLSRKLGGFNWDAVFVPFTKISYAALFMGLCVYIPLKFLDAYVVDTSHTLGLLLLTFITCFIGFGAYLLFTRLLNVAEINMFYRLLGRLHVLKRRDFSVRSENTQVTNY